MINMIMIAYIPVLHAGYMKLFRRYENQVDCLFVLGSRFIAEDPIIAREIRALKPEVSAQMIRALKFFSYVRVLDDDKALRRINKMEKKHIVVVGDAVSQRFAEKYLPGRTPTVETPFLRWDEESVNSAVEVKRDRMSVLPHDQYLMNIAREEAEKGSCWWRRVGAVVVDPVTGKVVLAAHNRHMPSEHTPYAVGDPRDFVKAGASPEIASTIHAEPALIAMAAKEGIALKGMHMYITVFPCGPCASIIAESGITKLFFASGCAYVDGDTILRSRGVEIILVS